VADTSRPIELLLEAINREVIASSEKFEERDAACRAERQLLAERITELEADKAAREEAERLAAAAAEAVAGVQAEHAQRVAVWRSRFLVALKWAGIVMAGIVGGRWGPLAVKLLGVDS